MPDQPAEWLPVTPAQRNARDRFKHWRVMRLDRQRRALLVPLDKHDKPILSERLWIESEQLISGRLAAPV